MCLQTQIRVHPECTVNPIRVHHRVHRKVGSTVHAGVEDYPGGSVGNIWVLKVNPEALPTEKG
jgi:hypothetical protein